MNLLTKDKVNAVQSLIGPYIRHTPTISLTPSLLEFLFPDTVFSFKFELLQLSGTFKIRGVLNNLLSREVMPKGVTAVSAGNHAIAVAIAAQILKLPCKVVMQVSANPGRVAAAKNAGAEIFIAKDGPTAFEMAHEIEASDDYLFIHPFDGMAVAEATASIAFEMLTDIPDIESIVVAIGGGGLSGGVSAGCHLIKPGVEVIGVEPVGAMTMHESFKQDKAVTLDTVSTIADSLAPPMTTDITFQMNKQNLKDLVSVTDEEMLTAVYLAFKELKIASEPGGVAAIAALLSERTNLQTRLKGKHVGVILCGSNMDTNSYVKTLERGRECYEQMGF